MRLKFSYPNLRLKLVAQNKIKLNLYFTTKTINSQQQQTIFCYKRLTFLLKYRKAKRWPVKQLGRCNKRYFVPIKAILFRAPPSSGKNTFAFRWHREWGDGLQLFGSSVAGCFNGWRVEACLILKQKCNAEYFSGGIKVIRCDTYFSK